MNRRQDLSGLQADNSNVRSLEPLPGLLDELRTGTREIGRVDPAFRCRFEEIAFFLVPQNVEASVPERAEGDPVRAART
jgi:hypothetical protein